MDGNDEQRWVLRAQAGEAQAFDQLLRAYERPLFRHVLRLVGSEDRAYEALQETFVAVVLHIRSLRSRECFRPWLFGVATRVSLKTLRKMGRLGDAEPENDAPDPMPLPDSLACAQQEREALLAKVTLLTPRLRSVVLLHFYEGLTLKEVAAALELSLGTVKSRLAAALEKLRSMEGGIDDAP